MTEQLLERSSLDGGESELLSFAPTDVVEVPLLISGQQMLALEEAAHDRGMTAGEMVRCLVQEFIKRSLPCKV